MFYLNRNGSPEGPFSEQQLLEMIQSGQLTEGWLAAQGQNQWAPLNTVPSLAAALAARGAGAQPMTGAVGGLAANPGAAPYGAGPGAAPAAYGAAPATYGAGPGAAPAYGVAPSTYGAGPAAAAPYNAGPAAYGAAPSAYVGGTTPASTNNAPKKSKGPLIFGLLAVVTVLLVALGGWALWDNLTGTSGPKIAAMVSDDVQAYLEVPNVRAAAIAATKAKHLTGKSRVDEGLLKDQAKAFADSFGITEGDALALVMAQHSMAVGARGFPLKPQAAVYLTVDASGPVETLLGSRRFVANGTVGSSGKRYRLTPAASPAPAGTDRASGIRRGLDSIETLDDMALVWWPGKKLMGLGSLALLEETSKVVDGGRAALAALPRFNDAVKDKLSSAIALAWVDGKVLQDAIAKSEVKGISLGDGGIAWSASADELGSVMRLVFTMTGSSFTGMPNIEPQALTYAERLPGETLMFLSAGYGKLSGAEREKSVVDGLRQNGPEVERQYQAFATEMKAMAGVTPIELLGAIGDELALGVTLAPSVKVIGAPQQLMSEGAAFVSVKLRDAALVSRATTQLRDKVLAKQLGPGMTANGAGFRMAAPFGPNTLVELRIVNNELVFAAGGAPSVERVFASLAGSGPFVAQDASFKNAFRNLPSKMTSLGWADTGRLAEVAFASSPMLSTKAKEGGFAIEDYVLSGPDRVTSAVVGIGNKVDTGFRVQNDSSNSVEFFLASAALGVAIAEKSGAGLGALMGMAGAGMPGGVPGGPLAVDPTAAGGAGAAGDCAKAARCCRAFIKRAGSGGNALAACEILEKQGNPSVCAQTLSSYAQGMKAFGGSCD